MKPIRLTTSAIHLDASQPAGESWNEVLRVGNWSNSYKQFEVTAAHLADFVANFKANVVRYSEGELPINYSHESQDKAAGWIEDLKVEGESLMAKTRWTPAAKQAITDEEYKYFSAEIFWEYEDQESKVKTNNVFTGLALTNIPFVSDMAAAKLDRGDSVTGDPNQPISISIFRMDKFKTMLAGLTAKTKVTAAELAGLKGALLMLDDTEQAEVKEEVDALEGKVEEEKPADAGNTDTEALARATREKELQLADAKKELASAHSRIDKLEADARRAKEAARIERLCTEGKILPKDKDSNIALLTRLSQKDADDVFTALDSGPAKVQFGEIGSGDNGEPAGATLSDDPLVQKAQELHLKEKESLGDKARGADVILAQLYADQDKQTR